MTSFGHEFAYLIGCAMREPACGSELGDSSTRASSSFCVRCQLLLLCCLPFQGVLGCYVLVVLGVLPGPLPLCGLAAPPLFRPSGVCAPPTTRYKRTSNKQDWAQPPPDPHTKHLQSTRNGNPGRRKEKAPPSPA